MSTDVNIIRDGIPTTWLGFVSLFSDVFTVAIFERQNVQNSITPDYHLYF